MNKTLGLFLSTLALTSNTNSQPPKSLHQAARQGDIRTLIMLLKTKARNINGRIRTGATPLHYAAKYGHYTCLSALVFCGAHVNVIDHIGWTPLHYAAANGNPSNVRILLGYGARVNTQNHIGQTPLHLALLNNNHKCVQMLLKASTSTSPAITNNQLSEKESENPAHRRILKLIADLLTEDCTEPPLQTQN
ncbi:ankyrin repeat domain-containing protein [bacterium]|nr:MAG: ankyrin repeat domain-containing protein [bacterium]